MKIPKQVNTVFSRLNQKGYEAFLVGGCVRDGLINVEQKDFDVTTNALPEETLKIFKDFKVIGTGLKHGTVTVIIEALPIEITTYRIDGEYLDSRRPENVQFTRNLKEDVARRDFTINSICYNPQVGYVDYFDGMKDIERKVIRAVGNPQKRFQEDPLRILRGLRFAAVLGFEIEEDTKMALLDKKELLCNISWERIAQEFIKTLMGPYAKGILLEYSSVIEVFIPEIAPLIGFDQRTKYHCYDVYNHSIVATEQIKNTKVLRLAAFFHDIGKPSTFTLDENGTGHFYGHGKASVTITENVLKRLRLDNDTIQQVLRLITYHDLPIENSEKTIKRWLNKLSPEGFFDLLELQKADCLAQNQAYLSRVEEIEKIQQQASQILLEGEPFNIKDLALNGNDLMDLGIPQGYEIGNTLKELLELVIEGELSNDRNELMDYVRKKRQI